MMLIFKQQNFYPEENKTLFRWLMRGNYIKALTYTQEEQKRILAKHSILITLHYSLD